MFRYRSTEERANMSGIFKEMQIPDVLLRCYRGLDRLETETERERERESQQGHDRWRNGYSHVPFAPHQSTQRFLTESPAGMPLMGHVDPWREGTNAN
jgi:hypothetical protein